VIIPVSKPVIMPVFSRFVQVLALVTMLAFSGTAQADPEIPEYGIGAGWYSSIGLGAHVNVENAIVPGVGLRGRIGLNGGEIAALMRLEVLYGFSGFVTLGAGYETRYSQPTLNGSLGLEYRPEFLPEFSIWGEYRSYWTPVATSNGTGWAFGLTYWFRP
jgi:hypothetical protein